MQPVYQERVGGHWLQPRYTPTISLATGLPGWWRSTHSLRQFSRRSNHGPSEQPKHRHSTANNQRNWPLQWTWQCAPHTTEHTSCQAHLCKHCIPAINQQIKSLCKHCITATNQRIRRHQRTHCPRRTTLHTACAIYTG